MTNMGKHTEISWTDHTFNPWWGCEKISAACANCYAETWAKRTGRSVWGRQSPRRFFGDNYWNEPLRWNAAAEKAGCRRRVFCASMADVFEDRADLIQPRYRMLKLIRSTPHLDWLLLTKRPENIGRLGIRAPGLHARDIGDTDIADWLFQWSIGTPPENLWLGTTVENQPSAALRIPELLKISAQVHFLSCEPLLGPFDFQAHCWNEFFGSHGEGSRWVIAGGESGRNARPSHPDWFRSLRDQCRSATVPFFFKQWGEWRPRGPDSLGYAAVDGCATIRLTDAGQNGHDLAAEGENHIHMNRCGTVKAGRHLDGVLHNEFPTQPKYEHGNHKQNTTRN